MKVFLTGAAGFIGFHTSLSLLSKGHEVYGYDSINDYYDPKYKHARLEILKSHKNFAFTQALLEDAKQLEVCVRKFQPSHILHLAAQAGVRYSLENPHAYINANIVGFQNMIEIARHLKPENFVYASSSSVYGANTKTPFAESDVTKDPISLYAVSKLSNELVANSYGHLFDLKSTGLRFFTVYGPIARPDMAMFKFAKSISENKKIDVYNHGKMRRDFTYIDDIVDGIEKSLAKPQINKVYNLGRGKSEDLMEMISLIEKHLERKAQMNFMPMQAGDVPATWSDVSLAQKEIGFTPKTDLRDGVAKFVKWFRDFHKV